MELEHSKAETFSRLRGLQRDRGAALLDNGKVPPVLRDQILETEAAVSAIDEAIGEQARRERVLAEQANAERRVAVLVNLKFQEAARLDAIGRGQTALNDLTTALKDALTAGAEVGRLSVDATGRAPPLNLDEHELARRLAGWVAASFSTVRHPRRFGGMTWAFTPEVAYAREAGKTWRETETEMGVLALDPIFNSGKETK